MKRADAQRASILVDALRAIDQEIAESLPRCEPGETWSFVGMRLGVADIGLGGGDDFGGVNIQSWVDIDIMTARLLVPLLRKLIEDELAALGVEP